MDKMAVYRAGAPERARTEDLFRLLPRGRHSVLDTGARDGYFSRLLTEYFAEVTALDLRKPSFEFPGVVTVAGDVTHLDFGADSFDCVFCVEVLEHVLDVQRACREIARVARHEIIIGVPFQQDIRIGRTTCRSCGGINPPWGHLHSFSEARLRSLFPGLRISSKSFVWRTQEATNQISTLLMDLAGNPWGTYEQDEPCGHCGAKLTPPTDRKPWQRVCSGIAERINCTQSLFIRPRWNWIHLVFSKQGKG